MIREICLALVIYGAILPPSLASAQERHGKCDCGAAGIPTAHAVRKCCRRSVGVDPATTNANSAPAPQTTTSTSAPAPPKPCDLDKERTLLSGATFEFDNLRFEKAASAYAALFDSCDSETRKQAEERFKEVDKEMTTWWWLEGRYFPPFRWHHHPKFWEALRQTLRILAVLVVVLLFFFYLPDLRLFHWLNAPFVIPLRNRFREAFLVYHLPRAAIMSPMGLTTATQANLFSSLLENASEEVRRVLDRAGGGLQVRATALLALPSETTSQLVNSLPKIKGVDVAGIAKFFLYLKRYLGWRVESQVGYCPSTKASDGTQSQPRVVASATLHHAFWVRGGPWPVKRSVQHDYDVDGVAFAVAARIMGFNMRGNRAR